MDFGTLLHVAKRKNEELTKNSGSNYYSTKFSAPKKESKDKKLSDNIKKFLAKREEEERAKAHEERQKREQLLAMRDEKAKNKIKKMLKVIKSANKSVLEDAVDNQNTAVTMQGPEQPDEDDYGYVSQEASALYKRYMDRVKSTPEENKFAPSRPSSRSDLAGTKDRVRAAIQREQDDINMPGTRTKSSTGASSSSSSILSSSLTTNSNGSSSGSHRRKDLYDPQIEREMEEKKRREEAQQKARNRPAAPPPMDFQQLLKLAEKKQYEPVEIVVEQKKEPERLLTKKEKKEMEERELREKRRKERRERKAGDDGGYSSSGGSARDTPGSNKMLPNGRIPKLNGSSSSTVPSTSKPQSIKPSSSGASAPMKSSESFKKPSAPISKVDSPKAKFADSKSNFTNSNKPKSSSQSSLSPKQQQQQQSSQPKSLASSKTNLKQSPTSSALKSKQSYDGPTREFPPRDITGSAKKAQLSNERSRQNGIGHDQTQKTRAFPPPNVRRDPSRRPPQQQPIKRRIYDDYDDEDEYDSELDDFIDDGPEEGGNYSSYIKEIFGYDKSRYRDLDDDDRTMESSFAQQMREECVSKKIGLMEDLEDMRQEAEEKKRKALMKKRKLK